MAKFDPLKSTNNTGPTEYAGNGGLFQAKVDGHVLSAQEKRMMLAEEGIRGAGVLEDIPETDEHWPAVERRRSEREQFRHPDWTIEDALS